MVCNDVKRIAYFYIDGQLGEQQGRDVAMHVLSCPECDTRLVIHRRIQHFVRGRLAATPASDALRAKCRSSVEADTGNRSRSQA